jgi:fatty acid desaturase
MARRGQATRREIESDLRKSLRVLPVQACITGATGILLLLWHSWFSWLAFGLTLFALVVDAVNVIYCQARLRRDSEGEA